VPSVLALSRKPIGFAAVDKRRCFACLAGAMAGGVALVSARGRGKTMDRRLFAAMNRDSGPAADRFFKGITELGSIWAAIGATAVLAPLGRRREALDALGAAAAMWSLGQILKRAVGRPRPYQAMPGVRLLVDEPKGSTWPSSHPAVLLAFVTVASRNIETPSTLRMSLTGLAGLVGMSRVYVGVHYPADVAAGLLLGRAVADLWSSAVSPATHGAPRSQRVPVTVSR
jgi:undecaprenyl-diphosphatase